MRPRSDRRAAVTECQPPLVGFELGVGVGGLNLTKRMEEVAAEVADTGKTLPELLMQGIPRNELILPGRDAMQALRQPDIDVKRH